MCQRCDVVMGIPKKRKHSGEEKTPEKRQKNTIEALNSKFTEPLDAKKFKKPEQSITALVRLRETKANSKVTRLIHENTTSRIRLHDTKTKPYKVLTTNPKPRQSTTALIRLRETKANFKFTRLIDENTTLRTRLHHHTKTKPTKVVITTNPGGDKIENQGHSLKDLIVKAQEKVQEKRQIDHRNTCIASQRLAARLALNQMVKTVDFDHHLEYHTELEKLGCDFIRDQVNCLNMFDSLSRSTYDIDESIFSLGEERNPTVW